MRLIISLEQSWPSGLLPLSLMGTVQVRETCFFSRQILQLVRQILFCPDVCAGHFQKLFQALIYSLT